MFVVVKEPPYSVKESGYAGFVLPIDICFRTDEEPKKVCFNYDLDLQPLKVQREKYVFRNPDEDLRRRLICGGGVCEELCMLLFGQSLCIYSVYTQVFPSSYFLVWCIVKFKLSILNDFSIFCIVGHFYKCAQHANWIFTLFFS
jgi:hypothetical protein